MARTSILGPLAFTAADNTVLESYDPNWTPISGGGGDGGFLIIRSNRLVLGYGVSPRIRFRNTRTYAADQWIGGTISNLAAGLSAVAFLLRMSGDVSPNDDWYAVEIDPIVSPTSTTILKCVNGSVSTLASSTSIAWASGDTVEFEAIGSGGSVELKVYRNGGTSTVLTHTDSTSPLTSGKPGIAFRGPGIGGGFYGTEVDGLDGGEVTAGGDATANGVTVTGAASLIAGSASGAASATASGRTLAAAASLIAGAASGVVNGTLNFQAAGMEFGARTGLGIGTFALDAGVSYRYTIHANGLTLGNPLYTSSAANLDSAGKLANYVGSAVAPGTTYRVVAIRQTDGEAAIFSMVAA